MSDSIDVLKRLALLIRNATMDGENTAERVGRTLVGIIEHLNDISIDDLYDIFLHKDRPDTAQAVITFLKGLTAGDFQQGSSGVGIWQDTARLPHRRRADEDFRQHEMREGGRAGRRVPLLHEYHR